MVPASLKMAPVSLKIPEMYQESVCFFLACLCVFAMTNTVMDIAPARHRWRRIVLASKAIGMTCTALCLIWPSQVAIYGLCLCLFSGFADPRLHIASIKRNPAHPAIKWFFCFALLAHHAGGAFVVSDMLKPVILDPSRNVADLEAPVIVCCLCEIFAWFTELHVLMRTAPKWFVGAHQMAVCIQVSACVVVLVKFPQVGLCPTTVAGAAGGNMAWLIAGMMKFKNSTHEALSEDAEKTASIARVFHNDCPLTEDRTLPFFKPNDGQS